MPLTASGLSIDSGSGDVVTDIDIVVISGALTGDAADV